MTERTTFDLEREPFAAPMAKSFGLHLLIVVLAAGYAFLAGRIHGAEWGDNKAPGAIQATLVSSAPSIPLPQDTPPTPNVLATDQPSPSPAPPEPKPVPVTPPPDAIPIPVKAPPKEKPKVEKKVEPAPKHSQPTPLQHRAQYGEAPPTSIPHSLAQNQGQTNPINITGGGTGFNFPYYVGIIQRKVQQAWYVREAAGNTPVGSQVKVTFTIARDGTPSNIRISQSSNSPTLDSSAVRAVQRIDSFGPLPPGYNKSNVSVEYTFTYDQPAH
ncbi:protein TonB [Silvibacterium bohemicum]|uniref:Protein TonB n=1 Tax=Silvibacterium bohemicum TaxID=1577686 RepID=A0A841JQ28_9BACT|nr:energy transducer TonB [Silvibacterium bohemicum]MBB6143443.1 protein TonB [Silvibacterium bohemicum]